MPSLRVLMLAGSPHDNFYRELSTVYARDCWAATADSARYDFGVAYATPDGCWRIAETLSDDGLAEAEPLSLSAVVAKIESAEFDVALPQMFCIPGMTCCRSLLDLLGIPFVGNEAAVMALAADKAKTRAVVQAAGVAVPVGEVLKPGEQPSIATPLVVKPVDADNSLGVSLVRSQAEIGPALEQAFNYGTSVLVERFVELGREVRCGIVQRGETLQCLPLQEYCMDAERQPIRGYASKLTNSPSGQLDLASKYGSQSRIVPVDDPIVSAVWDAAVQCHQAMGCRDYSLFDFRIDPSGKPFFLEAGLYCSFAPNSILSAMTKATGLSLGDFLQEMLQQAIRRDRRVPAD